MQPHLPRTPPALPIIRNPALSNLETKLCLAVGARVMLRCNLDTKAGLVNGAIGTVLSIASNHVTVQFDHVSTPHDVERVKSKFIVMKNFLYIVSNFLSFWHMLSPSTSVRAYH